jgi:hypothetical protein
MFVASTSSSILREELAAGADCVDGKTTDPVGGAGGLARDGPDADAAVIGGGGMALLGLS